MKRKAMAQQRNGWLGEGKEALLPPRTQATGHHLRFSLIRFQLETEKSKDATEKEKNELRKQEAAGASRPDSTLTLIWLLRHAAHPWRRKGGFPVKPVSTPGDRASWLRLTDDGKWMQQSEAIHLACGGLWMEEAGG